MAPKALVFIDGSYYCFYRYHATINWWRLARRDIELGLPSDNEEFVERYNATFVSSLQTFIKKEKLESPTIWVGKDYPDVWRNALIPAYKGGRDSTKHPDIGFFIDLAYRALFGTAGATQVLGMSGLEADDCIALAVGEITQSETHPDIMIITSDHDYLQLNRPRVELVNLKHQRLTESKKSHNNAELDLFCKVICGDKSDNIPGVIARVGPKTAVKLFHDPAKLEALLAKHPGARERLELNRTLIDFAHIPKALSEQFSRTVMRGVYKTYHKHGPSDRAPPRISGEGL